MGDRQGEPWHIGLSGNKESPGPAASLSQDEDNDDDDDGDDDDGGDGDDEHDDIPQAVSWPSPGAGIAAQAMWPNAIKSI